MPINHWLKSIMPVRVSHPRFQRRRGNQGQCKTKRRRLLSLELLEDRRVLAPLLVTSTSDNGPGSLREAIALANVSSDEDVISFDSVVFGSPQAIVLTTGQLTITNPLTINGTGADQLAVSGNHISRVFEIGYRVIASLSGITVRDGVGSGGGGIYNQGELTVSNSVITHNLADWGGGIYNAPYIGPALTVRNSAITYNSGIDGGGISGGGIIANSTLVRNFAGHIRLRPFHSLLAARLSRAVAKRWLFNRPSNTVASISGTFWTQTSEAPVSRGSLMAQSTSERFSRNWHRRVGLLL